MALTRQTTSTGLNSVNPTWMQHKNVFKVNAQQPLFYNEAHQMDESWEPIRNNFHPFHDFL
jgi:hypothetical protein